MKPRPACSTRRARTNGGRVFISLRRGSVRVPGPGTGSVSFVMALFLLLASLRAAVAQVPDPISHFGFTPGDDRHLANWSELSAYYDRVAAASDRVDVDTIGLSTGGLPMVMLTITSPANLARLEEIRAVQMRLADPRTIGSSAELDSLRAAARTIVLLTSHIHSTEVGAGQMPANLVYRLATSTDSVTTRILDEVVLIVIPSLNPDGTQLVSDWYRRYVGTRWEGIPPVELYHPYVGHDNNRDWYALTQKETQLVVEAAHNAWRPMIVHDVHQMGQRGARIFVPPYVEPYDPNVDPLLVDAINDAGRYMASELLSEGKTGVVTASQYDLFTPARAFMHYHGGARILSETASAKLATPIRVTGADLTSGSPGGLMPSENYPVPWEGGTWGLPQIVAYQESAALALLRHAADNRERWVDTFYNVNRRALEKWPEWPDYWVLPTDQPNEVGLASVLRILTLGGVEVHRTRAGFRSGPIEFAEGSYVIPMRQPYASWAQTLLEVQDYPFEAGGDRTAPYDVTAHTLPLLMEVRAFQVVGNLDVPLTDPIDPVPVILTAPEFLTGPDAPRIGIYRGWRESNQAGWTRWLFDAHGIAYTALSDADIRRGRLEERFDVILFQDQPAYQIVDGWDRREMPAEYAGGIGSDGLAAIRRFVDRGGRIVAIEAATEMVIDALRLGIREVPEMSRSSFYIPGAIVSLAVEPERRAEWGEGGGIAWFSRSSRAFGLVDRRSEILARYGEGNPRLSGLVLGGGRIAGQPAIVRTRVGRGSVVLFGFQPNYRGQSVASWPLLFRALAGEAGS